jgi:signal transduction histidine kinase
MGRRTALAKERSGWAADRALAWPTAVALRLSSLQLLLGAVVGVLALGLVHPVAYRSPSLRAAAETALILLALTAVWLLRAQFLRTPNLRKLLLLTALLLLGLSELLADALPVALQAESANGLTASAPISELAIAAILAAAAFTPPDRLIAGARQRLRISLVGCLAVLGAAELAGLLARSELLADSNYPGLGVDYALRHPLGLALLLITGALLLYATLDFARQGRLEGNPVLRLLAGGTLLLAAERLSYLTLPWVSPSGISLRIGFALAALALFLAAAVRRDRELRATLTRAAAIAERRRVAEDLHDGLAQDLAFIAACGGRLAGELGEEHPVVVAARRALSVSRYTIGGLTDMRSMPPREALEAIAHELGERFGIGIEVQAHPGTDLAPQAREHVARITREAIANAARHGQARHVVISLKPTEAGLALRVCDDGCGVREKACTALNGGGFGMHNMQERATALGGQLHVRARKAGGTELEVLLP